MTKANKIFMILMGIVAMTFSNGVNAEIVDNVYYQNDYNVKFSKEEYDTISSFYYDGYQKYMTQEDYERFVNIGIIDSEINTIMVYDNQNNSRTTAEHTTASKSLKVSYYCQNTTCTLGVILTWVKSPSIRSYDLIGAYSSTKDSLKLLEADISSGSAPVNYTEKKSESYGVSATLKLPSSGDDVRASATITAKKGSTVYVSYQHAKKSITLANSRKYSFNSGGYGNVFLFESSVSSYYDAMGGVKITL